MGDKWQALGKFIGSHTPILAPICIVAGVVLAPWLIGLKPFVPTLFAVMTFQGALGLRLDDVRQVARHPRNALIVLAVLLVAMPLIAYWLASLCFPFDRDVVLGAVIEFSQPAAVMGFMWIGLMGGNVVMALAVILVSSVVTPFTMPLTLSLLMGESVSMDSLGIMLDMLYMVAVPAVAGLAVNNATRGWGKRVLAPRLFTVSRLIFLFVITTNACSMAPYLDQVTWMTLAIALFILALAVLGFVIGTVLAKLLRLPVSELVAMGYSSGMRNISVGAVIAATYFSGSVVFTVIMAVMYQQVLAGLYSKVLMRLGAKRDGG